MYFVNRRAGATIVQKKSIRLAEPARPPTTERREGLSATNSGRLTIAMMRRRRENNPMQPT